MSGLTALCDACVPYPAPVRDVLLHVAATGLFRAKWTDRIHGEWIRNLLCNRPDITSRQLSRTRELMDASIPDCLVHRYEHLIDSLDLPDTEDRHVLAAAIKSMADVIVTFNLADFPRHTLDAYGIVAQHPDVFLCRLFAVSPSLVCAAINCQRAALQNPPRSVAELLHTFAAHGLTRTVAALEPSAHLL